MAAKKKPQAGVLKTKGMKAKKQMKRIAKGKKVVKKTAKKTGKK